MVVFRLVSSPTHPQPHTSHLPSARLARVERLAWLLDRSIPVGRWRIGLDPIIGFIPGLGDWIGAALSLYVLYQGVRLGIPVGVLTRMAGNILVETIVGEIPLLGDLFDFAWQANSRNVALIQRHYRPELRERSLRQLALVLGLFAAYALALLGLAAYAAFKVLMWIVAQF